MYLFYISICSDSDFYFRVVRSCIFISFINLPNTECLSNTIPLTGKAFLPELYMSKEQRVMVGGLHSLWHCVKGYLGKTLG